MKFIEKEAVTPVDDTTGGIYNTTNIENKNENTYSANVIDKLNTYSATEQVVGTWVDGRPIYRKVILTTMPAKGTSTTVGLETAMYTGFIEWAFGENNTGNKNIPLPYVGSDGIASIEQIYDTDTADDSYLVISNNNSNMANRRVWISLLYTKPTDKGNVMINFTVNCSHIDIGNKTYQAEYGMSWLEWIFSEYNVDGYYIEGTDIRLNAQYYLTSAKMTDTIQANTTYATSKGK